MKGSLGKHAIVVGAGMGGLVAAKALSTHFEKVTVLERDALPDGPQPRIGTPQARQLHVLLKGGLDALVEFFPVFEAELERAGAVRVRVGSEILIESPGFDPFPQRDLAFDTLCMTALWWNLWQGAWCRSKPTLRCVRVAASPDFWRRPTGPRSLASATTCWRVEAWKWRPILSSMHLRAAR